jgi:hypothetical protein
VHNAVVNKLSAKAIHYMSFASVPLEPKKQIDRAGKILCGKRLYLGDRYSLALDLANRWRACHAYPINTFQATLRVKLRSPAFGHDPIVAQRLKRMPTMIDKLRRYPAMQLTTMQDIGGVRAILDTVDNVYRLAREYQEKSRFKHALIQVKDYIDEPRDEDGYRSLHLIYRYQNERAPQYDGLRLELQIRTKLQHTWATAVETMGTFLGQALKSRQGSKEWIDFFAVISSAFAHQEKSRLIPRFAHLSKEDTHAAIAEAENRMGALETMRAFAFAVENMERQRGQGKSYSYHLIVLDSLNKTVTVKAYDRNSYDLAIADYSDVEQEAINGKKIEPVLVSAGPINILRQAYPNFFLDIAEFIRIVKKIVGKK